jgi:hypothetical protein
VDLLLTSVEAGTKQAADLKYGDERYFATRERKLAEAVALLGHPSDEARGAAAAFGERGALRHGRPAMLSVLFRVLGSLTGAIVIFALWLIAVLVRMPHPPVPPSFPVSLTAPVAAAAGFALGMQVVERLTQGRQGTILGTFLWTWAGGTLGMLVMYPFGGMMGGFGLFGLGTAALLVREVTLHTDGRHRPTRG